jgi:hypothetical protein
MVIYDRDRTRSIKKATTPSAVGGQTQNDPRHCRVHLSTPDSEQAGDEWDLAVFGLPGRLDFTKISQRWLREATKNWAAEDLPLHRGRQAASAARDTINAVVELSESLRLSRADLGDDPAAVGRRDILAFTNRLAYKQRTDQVTEASRLRIARRVRRFLDDVVPRWRCSVPELLRAPATAWRRSGWSGLTLTGSRPVDLWHSHPHVIAFHHRSRRAPSHASAPIYGTAAIWTSTSPSRWPSRWLSSVCPGSSTPKSSARRPWRCSRCWRRRA